MKIWDLGASGKAIPSWDITKFTDHLSGHYFVSRATRVYWFNHLEVKILKQNVMVMLESLSFQFLKYLLLTLYLKLENLHSSAKHLAQCSVKSSWSPFFKVCMDVFNRFQTNIPFEYYLKASEGQRIFYFHEV